MSKTIEDLDGQFCKFGKHKWRVSRLIKLVENFKPFRIPLKHLNTYDIYPKANSTQNYIYHVKSILDADLDFPIILDEEGCLMDGRHRIIKAMMNGERTVWAVRFDENPVPCEIEEDDDG